MIQDRRFLRLPFYIPAVVGLLALVLVALPPGAVRAAASYDVEARFEVDLHLDWDSRWVTVKTDIDLINRSGGAIDRLNLNTVAAKHGNLKNLKVRVDGTQVDATRSGQTIRVPLGAPLANDASVDLFVSYRARLTTTAASRAFFFAKLDGVAQLYRFIPWPSRKIPFGSQAHGEPFVTPVSPEVRVQVSSDRKLVWATTGRRVSKDGPKTFTYVARDVRDFNIAASPAYTTAKGLSRDGDTIIYSHTRSGNNRRLITLAKQELARYEALTGVQYPHDIYRIAETGGGLPMESPALTWIPRSRSSSELPYLISHETAHQWWYSTVGNDQSTDAFADEALSDYYSRRAHLSIRSSRCKTDRLDRNIQGYSTVCYFEVIYVQGSRFLNNLRKDYGDAKFKKAIRSYTQQHKHGVIGNVHLLEALRDEMGDGVLKRYRSRFPSIY